MHIHGCYGCQKLLITPRQRADDCKECIEQYFNDKFKISHGNEVLVTGVKPNGKLLETNMAVKACDPPLLHGAFQRSCCPPAPLPE